MTRTQEYDKVLPSNDENAGDDVETAGNDNDTDLVVTPSGFPVWKGIFIATLAFVAGILLGSVGIQYYNGGGGFKGTVGAQASTTTCTSAPQPQDDNKEAVSYGFLQTTRGINLLESLEEELMTNGPKSALQKLSTLLDTDEQVASSCHPLTHRLGRRSFEHYGLEAAFADMIGTPDATLLRLCNAAYMHGIIEHYLADSSNLHDDVNQLNTQICVHLDNINQGKWECRHGIGHGVIQYYRQKKQLETLQNSIQACQDTSFSQTCENGLWMDHFASTQVSGMLEPDSLLVCAELATDSFSCTIYAPTEFLLHHPRAYKQAIVFCNTGLANYTALANVCISGVGMQAAKENMQDFAPVEEACLTAPTDQQQKECFQQGLSYYGMTTGGAKIPASVCEHLTVYKSLCLEHGK